VARALTPAGLVVGSVGNLSWRFVDTMRITPSRRAYASLRRRDLVTVDIAGGRLTGRHAPSRELPLHLAIYRARADVHVIVHAHGPHATAWSFGREPVPDGEELEYYGLGPIRTAHHAPAGTTELADHAARVLGASRAVLLERHGLVAVGPNRASAFEAATVVEHACRVALLRLHV
jgi:L-fuculose-phosphate aldolase